MGEFRVCQGVVHWLASEKMADTHPSGVKKRLCLPIKAGGFARLGIPIFTQVTVTTPCAILGSLESQLVGLEPSRLNLVTDHGTNE